MLALANATKSLEVLGAWAMLVSFFRANGIISLPRVAAKLVCNSFIRLWYSASVPCSGSTGGTARFWISNPICFISAAPMRNFAYNKADIVVSFSCLSAILFDTPDEVSRSAATKCPRISVNARVNSNRYLDRYVSASFCSGYW